MGKKRFITARDVDELLGQGQSELMVDMDTVVTDLGRERARERGLRIVEGASTGPGPSSHPSPTGSSGEQTAGRSKSELAEIVTRVVVTHLGSKPANLESVIAKVLDRH